MKVRLVSITNSCVTEKDLTAEELLVYIARVSNPSNQLNTETSDKLLGYMIRNKHWSPFDMVNMTVEVTTSRAIAHQILRHWSIKPQEFSQRYAEATSYEPIQLRLAGATNRQSSTEKIVDIYFHDEIGSATMNWHSYDQDYGDLARRVSHHIEDGDQLYKDLIKAGFAKECARFVLPLSTSTTMYLNGSVRSWIHYLEQRTDQHAQLEHRQVAEEIKAIFKTHFPNICKALGI